MGEQRRVGAVGPHEVAREPGSRPGDVLAEDGGAKAGPAHVGLDDRDPLTVGRRGQSEVRADRALALTLAAAREREHLGPALRG